jgi:hypothetical protein
MSSALPLHGSLAYFAFFELGRAFIAMLFYVLLRPRTGPGWGGRPPSPGC